MLLKRLLCRHEWMIVVHDCANYYPIYGCNKCGAIVDIDSIPERAKWKFKRQVKGDTFID